MIHSDQTVNKEYQIPELVDLNSIIETQAADCMSGSGAGLSFNCGMGTGGGA